MFAWKVPTCPPLHSVDSCYFPFGLASFSVPEWMIKSMSCVMRKEAPSPASDLERSTNVASGEAGADLNICARHGPFYRPAKWANPYGHIERRENFFACDWLA